MASQDEDLINEFVIESNEHLADIENQLLAIEAGGTNVEIDLVNKVFRAIHSIKGAAGFLGLTTINRLAHVMENVLNRIRSKTLVPTSPTIDLLLKAADTLRQLINNTNNSASFDITGHISALEAVNALPEERSKSPDVVATSEAETKEIPLPVAVVTPPEDASSESETAPPCVAPISPPAMSSSPIVQEQPVQDKIIANTAEQVTKPATTPAASANSSAASADTTANVAATPAAETNIRVSVSVLDHLMNLAGELVLSRNQLLQAVEKDEKASLHTASNGLDQVTSELQEAIMRTRMQPVGNVFSRFPRVVRDLSAKLGKQVELAIEGKDVEVDKTIVEAIGDPLTHLIRNSVDHGIELPNVRESRGKKPTGNIFLKAYHQAGKVRIDVEDDGNGISPEKLKTKAVSMGLITPERASQMSDREAARLIFHPGLSTAAKVTDVSGRGVGMDVVKTNIEKLGGNVDVESTPGQGTIIRITLPLTLAIIPSLIVRCGDERFAIPQINIVELVRLKSEEINQRIGRIKHAEVLRLRDSLLPLVRLDTALGWKSNRGEACDKNPINIIVLESSQLRYGLVVDGLHDSEEIVVKALGRHLKDCRCLAGATILGDGHVALILDIDGIAHQTRLRVIDQRDDLKQNDAESIRATRDLLTVLLFSNDPSEQFAVPMALVSRIERIRADQIDRVGGQELLQYRGGTLPLLGVESKIRAKPRPDRKQLYVVVFNMGGRELGLVAPHLEDIRDVSTIMDTVTLREAGVIGTLVVDGKTTRLLDMSELARAAHPEWFPQAASLSPVATAPPVVTQPTPNAPVANAVASTTAVTAANSTAAVPEAIASLANSTNAPTKRRILVAEDSPFFRKQVVGFLKGAGLEIVAFEDGRQAWEYLEKNPRGVELVVTDIEMPVMNGLQLCRNVKDCPATMHLPVIALTTLASDEDIQRGMDAGVSDYQIKMDRDNLLASVRRLLLGESQEDDSIDVQQIQEITA